MKVLVVLVSLAVLLAHEKRAALGQADGINALATSFDGINWTGQGRHGFVYANGIGYGGNIWVATGDNIEATTKTSPNGQQWYSAKSGLNLEQGQAVAYSQELHEILVLGIPTPKPPGNNESNIYNAMSSFDDGASWQAVMIGGFGEGTSGPSAIAYGDGKWVAVGCCSTGISYSTNASGNWTTISTDNLSFAGLAVAYSEEQGLWVAVGGYPMSHLIVVLSDGVNWKTLVQPGLGTKGSLSSVAYGNGIWVAVGRSDAGTIFTSTDGKRWTVNSVNNVSSGFGNTVCYSDNPRKLWVAVGQWVDESQNPIAIIVSSDGLTWQAVYTDVFAANAGLSVAYSVNQGMWIATSGEGV